MSDGIPLNKSWLETAPGKRVDEGEDDSSGRYDYSHMLTPEHRAAGYSLHVEHSPFDDNAHQWNVDVLHRGEYVGGVNGYVGEPRRSLTDPSQFRRAIEIELADLDDAHQKKGLGRIAMKAGILHGQRFLGGTHVDLGDHSTLASKALSGISSEANLGYTPKPQQNNNPAGAYDKKFGPTSFNLPLRQSEREEYDDLTKALASQDFKSIVGALDANGPSVVDHTPHMQAHPQQMQGDVGFYNQTFLHNPNVMRKMKSPKLGGVSKKVVLEAPARSQDAPGTKYMIKPYHERVTRGAKDWMHQDRPAQGWAEMTNQSLFHAAGMGHMHQKVHTAEHNLGPGHEQEPALVVHMEPGMDAVRNLGIKIGYDESMLHDATKIGVMDFLANNLDRHSENLLVRQDAYHDPSKHPSRLLAIDHGRNFNYKSKTKMVREELEMGAPKESILEDSLSNYLANSGIRKISGEAAVVGDPRASDMNHLVPAIAQWWPSVRDNVVRTMHQHVGQLKDQGHRSHIWKNFMERVEKLDDVSRFPDDFIDAGKEVFNTPIWTPEESANAYNPYQRF